MFVTNMTVEERLSRAVVAWMRREPSLSGVLMVGNRSVSNEIPTAATNGRDEWYNREFMDALNDAMVRFVVIHEVYHKMYRHPTTWAHLAKICSRTANIAMDYVINHKIMKAYGADGFVQMPENITYGDGQYFQKCFYDDKYEDWDTAKVFWDIYNASGGEGEGGPGPGSESPDGETGSGMCPNGGLFDEIDFDGAEELTREEKQELEREIDEALRQGALAAGKMGSGGNRDVDELLEPKINWREALRQWATATCAGTGISTWRKPNRRYLAGGYYMPSQISDALPSVHCSNDMSGSIGDVEAKIMVTITYWDTEVCGYERYGREELDTVVDRTNPVGGGGTDPTVVPKYLKEHGIKPTASIVLTDGYIWGEWGDWDHPVLWVIIDNKNATPPCGSVIHVKREDFING
jgi:predicted metal-dependent peptidase